MNLTFPRKSLENPKKVGQEWDKFFIDQANGYVNVHIETEKIRPHFPF